MPFSFLLEIAWYWWAGAAVLTVLVYASVFFIPNNVVGVVEKRYSAKGSVTSGLIALDGEAGFQPAVLRGGLHLLVPFQTRVHRVPLVTIPQGKIGYVFARDGKVLHPTQALAQTVGDFQEVTAFLKNGGQRGPQRQILREGTHVLNLAQFVVLTESRAFYLPLDAGEGVLFRNMAELIKERQGFEPVVIRGTEDSLGVVTVHDGPSLPQNEIIAPAVGDNPADVRTYHNKFQDAEAFLAAGGMRGRQLQVLVEGTYYINRLFATVELVKKTVIEVGYAGVVVSYTGAAGQDLSGADYKHGELVETGRRGVWRDPLLPGKFPFNTYAGKVMLVPTTNVILKWKTNEAGSHRFDENLSEVSLITKDAFEPLLPLSVVVHIDYRKASLVMLRFGDIKRLVEQTLDPMVSAYFKNVGQTRTLIQLVQERSEIQQQASEQMREKFAQYNLELLEVLIGTPTSSAGDLNIEELLRQLRQRQIAEEQVQTFVQMEKAAAQERQLREAEARSKQQTHLTESELSITVQGNQGKADYQRSVHQAAQIKAMAQAEADKLRTMAEAEASKVRMMADAEAERAARVGVAQAVAVEEQVRAYGGPRFQLTQQVMSRFAEAIAATGVEVVPRIMISGAGGGGGGGGSGTGGGSNNLLESLLTLLLSDRLENIIPAAAPGAGNETVKAYRDQVRADLKESMRNKAP